MRLFQLKWFAPNIDIINLFCETNLGASLSRTSFSNLGTILEALGCQGALAPGERLGAPGQRLGAAPGSALVLGSLANPMPILL